jgi:branched-chain amino acid transport system permease protein
MHTQPGTVRVSSLAAGAVAVLILLPFAADGIGMPTLVSLATLMLIYGIAASSLNLVLGYGGLISFGHAAFFGVGGYVVGILNQQFVSESPLFGFIPGTNALLITLTIAVIAGGMLAAAIGALSLRTSKVQFIMITLAFAQMLFYFFVSLKAYGGDDGLIIRHRNVLPGFDLRNDNPFYYLCLAISILFLWLLSRVVRSRFGFVLVGIRQNERRMSALSFAPYPYKLVAFILSGMGCGLAGALMANDQGFVSPDMLNWSQSGELMIMIVLGGVGTLFGPFLGAATFVALETSLSAWTENWQIILGPILLAVVLFSHGGLHALCKSLWRKRQNV